LQTLLTKQKNCKILKLVCFKLQKKLQCKNAEDTAEEVHHTLEIQNMEQAVNDLQVQLAEKCAQLKSYEEVSLVFFLSHSTST
jgi:hypothetical protein